MSVVEDLKFFLDVVRFESRGKSQEEMLYLYKKIFELSLRASEEDYPYYMENVTQELHNTILNALTLAELILHYNNPGLRNPETQETFGEIIGSLEPTEFDINFDEDFDARSSSRRMWVFSFLWEMQKSLDGWLVSIPV
jgi:hypothetical protein